VRHIPELDGLRAVAVTAVVLFHARPNGVFSGGFVGVDLFFVLSAFLISSLLDENPKLGRFYWRRFCRLMPALLLMLAGYLVAAPFIWQGYDHGRDALLAGLYLSDYSYAFVKLPLYLQHTWSLAVEEQFYLLWPLMFFALLRAKHPVPILIAAYVAMTLWRVGTGDWQQYYYRFDTHATGLILGAALFFYRPKLGQLSAYAALTGLAVILVVAHIQHSSLVITLAEICAAILICSPPQWLSRFEWLGKRSYAVYLWHFPIIYYLREHLSFVATAAIGFTASVAMAQLSYITVEAWGRTLRDRVERRWRVPVQILGGEPVG
jgi:peptidoglycan/LPS O-acetylase OafA/YrhL